MSIRLGPLLYLLPSGGPDEWAFAVRVLCDEDDDPRLGFEETAGVAKGDRVTAVLPVLPTGTRLHTWTVRVARDPAPREVRYRIDLGDASGDAVPVAVPALGALPRLAFTSCAGFQSAADARTVEDPLRMWRVLLDRHERGRRGGHRDDPSPFHVLVGLGDQVYADSIAEYDALDRETRDWHETRRHSPAFLDRMRRAYADLYRRRWSAPDVARVLARVPMANTWDDHEIFDGWGSRPPWIAEAARYRDAYRAAREAFVTYQLGGLGGETLQPPPGVVNGARSEGPYLAHHAFRETAAWLDLILLDLRTARTLDQVLGEEQWRDLDGLLARYRGEVESAGGGAAPSRHVVVVSSVPAVFVRSGLAASVLRVAPGPQGIEDDLIDQWLHERHQAEAAHLLGTLFRLQKDTGCTVTLVSGDVHVASWGSVRTRSPHWLRPGQAEAVILQLTTSPIVNQPVRGLAWLLLDAASSTDRHVLANGIEVGLHEMAPGEVLLPARNFLSVGFAGDPDGAAVMWGEWVVEDGRKRKQVVIHP